MNFIKKSLTNIKPKLNKITDKASKAVDELKPKLKTISTTTKKAVEDYLNLDKKPQAQLSVEEEIIMVTPRIYFMSFPSEEKREAVSNYLNKKFGSSYYIWNVSEQTYNTTPFRDQVINMCVAGYPCLPLKNIFAACRSISAWLMTNGNNIAIVHCQGGKGRSALVIVYLLCLLKVCQDPNEALHYFCKTTNLSEKSLFFPTQKLYFKYFSQLLSEGFKPNLKRVKIQKIIFEEVPKVKATVAILETKNKGEDFDELKFRPYIQVYQEGKMYYTSLDGLRARDIKTYEEGETVVFEPDMDVLGDVFIRCKHFQGEKERRPVFRLMFNTAFVSGETIHFGKKEMDVSSEVIVSDNFSVKIEYKILEEEDDEEETAEWKKINEQINTTHKPQSVQNGDQNTSIALPKPFSIHEEDSPIDPEKMDTPTKNENESTPKIDPSLIHKILNNLKEEDEGSMEHEVDDYLSKLES